MSPECIETSDGEEVSLYWLEDLMLIVGADRCIFPRPAQVAEEIHNSPVPRRCGCKWISEIPGLTET